VVAAAKQRLVVGEAAGASQDPPRAAQRCSQSPAAARPACQPPAHSVQPLPAGRCCPPSASWRPGWSAGPPDRHHSVGCEESLLHAVAMVHVDVQIEHSGRSGETRKDGTGRVNYGTVGWKGLGRRAEEKRGCGRVACVGGPGPGTAAVRAVGSRSTLARSWAEAGRTAGGT
jgi:hypothetical protein